MKYFIYIIIFILPVTVTGQSNDGDINTRVINVKALDKIGQNISGFSKKVEKKTLQTLARLQKHERKLQNKLAAKDSAAAAQLFRNDSTYTSLSRQIKSPSAQKALKQYIPGFDSIKTVFKFLDQSKTVSDKFPTEWSEKITATNKSIKELESRLQTATDIKRIIRERKQQIREQFEKYGMGKELKKLNKEVYYYQQQLNEYKALLRDPRKLEQRAIAELRKLPAFNDFMKKNSMLAQLFKQPENYGSPESLAGLQTRASVQAQLQGRFASAGGNPQQYVQQQMKQANAVMKKIKDKVNQLGGGGSDMELPDFKPNMQKTKSFFKRVEYGANIQSQKASGILPVTSDLALTAGYKLNDRSVIGIGVSYKLGWGSGINNIKLTHQGVGLRSYVDVKLKGSIWITGGYEQNYQRAFDKIEQLKQFDAWQTSGLLGLSKKYKVGKKTSNVQVLWDFMSYRQVPRRQAVVFRIGYKL